MTITNLSRLPEQLGAIIPRPLLQWLQNLISTMDKKLELLTTYAAGNVIIATGDGDVEDSGKSQPTGEFVGDTDTQTLTNKTLTTPTIADFTNAGHDHQDADDGGQLDHGLAMTAATLLDDDHTQYDLLAGRAGGQTSYGGTAAGEDRKIISTSHATKGSIYIGGDGGTTDYTEIEADGTVRFAGAATVWDDVRISAGNFDRPGVSDPSYVLYYPAGGAIGTYLPEFDIDDVVSFPVQIPHSYQSGEDIYVHVHWTPGPRGNEENGAMVGWKIDYSWASINANFAAMQTLDLSDACDGTDHKHQMTPDTVITGSGKGISSMLICNLRRSDTGTDDTWAGTISGQLPLVLEVDFHFPIDTVGSRDRTAK